MINVVFLLPIFFMIAGSLSVAESIEVKWPVSISSSVPKRDTLRLLLGPDCLLALDGEVMVEARLLAHVNKRLVDASELRMQLKAYAQAVGNRVVLLLVGLRAAGVERLRLLTLPTTQ